MKYILDYFSSMTGGYMPGIKTDKIDLRHRFIQGFIPHYFNLASEATDSTTFKQKINPPYPLVLSGASASVTGKADKYPIVIIANDDDALSTVIYSTNLWEIFVDGSSETALGIPTGAPASNVGIDLAILNGKILTSHPTTVTRLYHGAIDATPAWAATTGLAVSAGVTHVLKNFEDRCLVVDASGGANTPRDLVQIVLPDYSIIAGIDLGDTYDVLDLANYQDRYALIFARKSASPRLSHNTIVFLWNGVAGDDYDDKVVLKGVYKCSIEKDGVVYVFTQIGLTTVCYAFNGSGFQEIGRLRNTTISPTSLIPKTAIGIEGDFFVLIATSSGNTTAGALLYWNPSTGESFYLLKAADSLPATCLVIAQTPSTAAYARFYGYQNSGAVGMLRKIEIENETKSTTGANYKSNFIPAPIDPNVHGEDGIGRIKINRVDIEYSVVAPSSSDSIGFTLTVKDEHTNETYSTYTAAASNTTANSTNAAIEDKRAIIDGIGLLATEFAIDLAVAVATSSWNLIIRRIVIHYDPVAHLT